MIVNRQGFFPAFFIEVKMTVSTTTNKVAYIGNGVATTFAIPFPFLEKEHLKVRQLLNNVQTERTDWTISDGNMVFETAPADGAQILIMREVPLTQETDYRENEILPAETLERNFDKLTMQVQQLKEQAERAITIDVFDNTDAAGLIPSIRQAVSDCAMYVTTATQKAQQAVTQAENAATQAKNAATSAQEAETSRQAAAGLLDSKADKATYASKSVRGVALWASEKANISEIRPACVVECYKNGGNWYRLWSDGWIEQGYSIAGSTASLTFLKPFKDTNYSIAGTPVTYSSYGVQSVSITSKTTTGISWAGTNYSSANWYFCGY